MFTEIAPEKMHSVITNRYETLIASQDLAELTVWVLQGAERCVYTVGSGKGGSQAFRNIN